MFKQRITKILAKGGEEKMKFLRTMIVLAFVLSLVSPCFAFKSSGAITVSAVIPTLSQALSVSITPVNPDNDQWDSATVTNMSGFGGLSVDTVNNIWTAGRYYAVDVGVTDNSGTTWYLNHAVSSIRRGATSDTLDYNVNVSMVKITKSGTTETETPIQKKVFAESAVTSTTMLNKTALSGGWLRIYYGVATGETAKDAPNAVPILLDRQAGTYTGSVTITLSP